MEQEHSIWHVFIGTFLVSSLAGLASLLRSGKQIAWTTVLSSLLNSGLLGLAIVFIWYHYYIENIFFLVGISILAGLGGSAAIDFILAAIKSGGLTINLSKEGKGAEFKNEKLDK